MIRHIIPNWTTNSPVFLLEIQNIYNKDFVNFPIFVNIGQQSGVNNFDSSIIFNYTNNYKNLAFYSQGEILDTEVELWDILNKQAQLWVRIPFIKANSTTYVTLQIDTNKTNDKVTPIGSAQDVWHSSFRAVYHFSQDPTTEVKDSTYNQIHLTPYNLTSSCTVDCCNEDGKYVGKGIQFNNGVTGQYLKSTSSYDFNSLTNEYTVICLTKWDAVDLDWMTMSSFGISSNGCIDFIISHSNTTYYSLACYGDAVQSSFSINLDVFKVVLGINDNSTLYFSYNGGLDYQINSVSFTDHSSANLFIGNFDGSSSNWFKGQLKNFFIVNKAFDQLDCQIWTKNLHDKLIIYRG